MSRKKGKRKAKAPAKSTPRQTPSKPHPSRSWPVHETTAFHFSLADEARRMSKHHTAAFEAGRKLRHLPVQFVSAGHLEGTIEPARPASPDAADVMAQMSIRSPSPSASQTSSSDDEVVFKGRGEMHPPPVAAAYVSAPAGGAIIISTSAESSTEIDTTVTVATEIRSSVQESTRPSTASPAHQDTDSDADNIVAQDQFAKRRKGRPAWEGTTTPWEHRSKPNIGWLPVKQRPDFDAFLRGDVKPPNAAMHDYAQNAEKIDLDGQMATLYVFSHRDMDLGTGHHNEDDDAEAAGNDSWDSDASHDLEELSTSAEKRLVQAFDHDALHHEQQESSDIDSTDASEDELDDEALARLLQKQEDLGLDDDFGFDDLSAEAFSGSFGRPNKKRQARVRGNHEPVFPSASTMADALSMDPYNGFDIMDTQRPSLRPKKKGRRGQLPLEIDDSEMHEQLQSMWETDRAKKRIKKAERQELRQQGLLGRKGKSPNLKVKYQGGIGVEDVVEEIREFLLGEMQSLALPPMEARHRASVHQVSRYFELNSRSRGEGQDRFTVLTKTSRTRVWTDDEFESIVQRKDFFKRLQNMMHPKSSTRFAKRSGTRQGGSSTNAHISYRDGDTVGANAPELGPENKGHALLTKMGWSKGIGLGAVDNKGILQPIPHTVKMNKAGLQ